jgi:hypothetical protein
MMLYNATTIYGQQVAVPTKTKDAMLATLENSEASDARKKLAKEILAWYSREVSKPPLTGKSELDKAAQVMMIDFHADLLWGGGYLLEKRSVAGVETLVIVNQEGEPINSYRDRA